MPGSLKLICCTTLWATKAARPSSLLRQQSAAKPVPVAQYLAIVISALCLACLKKQQKRQQKNPKPLLSSVKVFRDCLHYTCAALCRVGRGALCVLWLSLSALLVHLHFQPKTCTVFLLLHPTAGRSPPGPSKFFLIILLHIPLSNPACGPGSPVCLCTYFVYYILKGRVLGQACLFAVHPGLRLRHTGTVLQYS